MLIRKGKNACGPSISIVIDSSLEQEDGGVGHHLPRQPPGSSEAGWHESNAEISECRHDERVVTA